MLTFSGCGMGSLPDFARPKAQIHTVKFASGLQITSPDAYCANRKLTRNADAKGFAIFTPCTENDYPSSMITVSVSAVSDAARPTDADLRAALLKTPKARDYKRRGDLHIATIRDTAAANRLGMDPIYYRAVTLRQNALILTSYFQKPKGKTSQSTAAKVLSQVTFALPGTQTQTAQDQRTTPDPVQAGVTPPRLRPDPEMTQTVSIKAAPMLKPVYRP
jgi:hypothetical protein